MTYWDWNLVPVLDDGGEVEVLFFCLNDVTESRRSDERVRQVMHQPAVQPAGRFPGKRTAEDRAHPARRDRQAMAVKLTLQNRVPRSSASGEGLMHDVLEAINQVIGRIRQISLDLRPPVLDDLGLVPHWSGWSATKARGMNSMCRSGTSG